MWIRIRISFFDAFSQKGTPFLRDNKLKTIGFEQVVESIRAEKQDCQLDHSSVGNSWSFFSGCRRHKSGCIGLTTIFSPSKVIPFYFIT
jgi:hypothetical protein